MTRPDSLPVIHQEALERLDRHVRERLRDFAHQRQALVDAEERGARPVDAYRHDDAREQLRRPLDEIEVPVRRRVEAAGVDCEPGSLVAHGLAPVVGAFGTAFGLGCGATGAGF